MLVAVGIGVAACSSGPSGPTVGSGTSGRSGSTITIENFAFGPDPLRVSPGAEITVDNKDGVTHTVTSTTGAFDTGDIQSGQVGHFTAPSRAGTYPYRCNIHQFMTGTLVVTSG